MAGRKKRTNPVNVKIVPTSDENVTAVVVPQEQEDASANNKTVGRGRKRKAVVTTEQEEQRSEPESTANSERPKRGKRVVISEQPPEVREIASAPASTESTSTGLRRSSRTATKASTAAADAAANARSASSSTTSGESKKTAKTKRNTNKSVKKNDRETSVEQERKSKNKAENDNNNNNIDVKKSSNRKRTQPQVKNEDENVVENEEPKETVKPKTTVKRKQTKGAVPKEHPEEIPDRVTYEEPATTSTTTKRLGRRAAAVVENIVKTESAPKPTKGRSTKRSRQTAVNNDDQLDIAQPSNSNSEMNDSEQVDIKRPTRRNAKKIVDDKPIEMEVPVVENKREQRRQQISEQTTESIQQQVTNDNKTVQLNNNEQEMVEPSERATMSKTKTEPKTRLKRLQKPVVQPTASSLIQQEGKKDVDVKVDEQASVKSPEQSVPKIDEPPEDKCQATEKISESTKAATTTSMSHEPAVEMETIMRSDGDEKKKQQKEDYFVEMVDDNSQQGKVVENNQNAMDENDHRKIAVEMSVSGDELQEQQKNVKDNIDDCKEIPMDITNMDKNTSSSSLDDTIKIEYDSKNYSVISDSLVGKVSKVETNKEPLQMKTVSTSDNKPSCELNVIGDFNQMKRKQEQETSKLEHVKRVKLVDVGDLFTMGDQISKELGPREVNFRERKATRNQPARIRLGSLMKVRQVALGALHTLAITEDGKVLSFGCNDDFVLGRPLTRTENGSNGNADNNDVSDDEDNLNEDDYEEKMSGLPLPVKDLYHSKVIKVSAGDMHSAALCEDGKVYVWGNFKDESDKLGLFVDGEKAPNFNDYLPVILPKQVDFDMKVVDIASGCHHLLLLADDGKVYTFGEGSKGQLGRIIQADLNSIKNNRQLFLKPQPVAIPDNVPIERVFASQWNSFAVSKDGQLYGWGLNNFYQLGIKNKTISSIDLCALLILKPTRIPIQFKVAQVANGQQHSLILDMNGNVYSCGSALYGKLGHGQEFIKQCGDDSSISEFKQIPAKYFNHERIVKIDCGDFCSMAISDSGKLYSWGQGAALIGTEEGQDLFEPQLIRGTYADCTKFLHISTGAQMAALIGIIQNDQHDNDGQSSVKTTTT